MAQIRPFAGIRYGKQFTDLSNLIAPPYDVLDEASKSSIAARHPNNIVTVDAPWMPPKTLGPDEVYEKANVTLQAWLSSGVLARDRRPALYPYTQSYEHSGRTFHRRGFFALVKLTPFGEDVIPHEKTYKGPIEDRLKLMKTTGVQLSPIFGLFDDPRNEVNAILYKNAGRPQQSGTIDKIKSDLWSVIDAEQEIQVQDAMKDKKIYIADGHHRYTTALQYQQDAIKANGGSLPPTHPANYCLFVLVPMQDDGLLILPTHRLIGGLDGFDMQIFTATVKEHFDVEETKLTPEQWDAAAPDLENRKKNREFALYVGATKKLYLLKLKNIDVIKPLEPKQSEDWRRLDVAILQRYLIDEVLQPEFSKPDDLTRGYTADASAIRKEVDGKKFQVAIMLRSTPLQALIELGKHGEVMPQKSTYFFPKLATGMVINPLT